MIRPRTATLAGALVGLAAVGQTQHSGWDQGQVNATMCVWSQPRAAVIRDTVYIDGGALWWSRGMNDGSFAIPTNDGNPLGLMLSLNFSLPFNVTNNLTALFVATSKAAGGAGSSNNLAPNYVDGAMLANDAEFFLYGGLTRRTAAFPDQYPDEVLAYQAYAYGPEKPAWRPGFVSARLTAGTTRYVAFGGAANAPSEQKAWYFSGLRSPSSGVIYTTSSNQSINAVNVSSTLITLDLERQQQEVWRNDTLPDYIKGRANPEVVWVPVGPQGILVVLGGVVLPDWAYVTQQSPNRALAETEGNEFISTIDIYDVATKTWFRQPTQGGPTALTRGCAVVATAADRSSFNIYYYGGYNGIDGTKDFNDDVWVLSLPSFTWTKLKAGTAMHARAGHKCVVPYPDQMMVIGGTTPLAGSSISCLQSGTFVTVFNLTSGEWQDSYDPAKFGAYGVPTAVQQKIGGGSAGGATAKEPVPSGWATASLGSVFATPYPVEKLKTFYPYSPAASTGRPTFTETPGGGGGGSNLPSWVAPTLGVILGLVLISSLIVGCFLWRRRKVLSRRGNSEAGTGTEDNGMRIMSWIRGQQTETKALTVTTDETPTTPGPQHMSEVSSPLQAPAVAHPPDSFHEVANTQIHELPDTSRESELADTGLSPVAIINKHWRLANRENSVTSSSYNSESNYSDDQNSTISRSSGALGSRYQDSLLLGRAPSTESTNPPARRPNRIVSGVSNISDREVGHLRQISEATVSSQESGAVGQTVPEGHEGSTAAHQGQLDVPGPAAGPPTPSTPGSFVSPISPPTLNEAAASDYMNAWLPGPPAVPAGQTNSPSSPLRKSVFYESQADLQDKNK